MYKNLFIYFMLFNLIQFLLVEINCQSFEPSQRYLHTATLIDDKLYILGGLEDIPGPHRTSGSAGNQFFYLDVSVPFNTRTLSWNDLSSSNIVPSHIGAAAVRGGKNNDTLILYGGRNLTSNENMASVYLFDTQINTWSSLIINRENFIKRRGLTAIIDNKGNVYLFGGRLIGVDSFVNDMLILDTINFSWGISNSTNAPRPRINYGAVILPNQKIVYIGGMNFFNAGLSLGEVNIYDTINDKWEVKETSGLIPSGRFGLSAVLGLDGQTIIIFGGAVNPEDSLYTLDVNNFEWSIPKTSGIIPNSRYMHKANVVGKYMVVTFGFGYNQTESDVILLDISNNDEYVWTIDFDPSTSSLPSPAKKSKAIGVISITLLVVSLLSLTTGLFFLYKWNKNRKLQSIVAPVSNDKIDNNHDKSGQKANLTTLENVYKHDQQKIKSIEV